MPVQANFLNHFITTPSFIGAKYNVEENDNINNNARKNVKTMETSDKKEEISK